ncbi:META and DUF4377 domain-containing protein [uncultured Aquitalea sp.]|uniref:META and DUF4377 domain-containing protein n=1 Tax=uncultured Aquitalea sp. TaxID=540272 RepID=UPI0025DBDAEA|nr:META and DUF4377 domain-containing protein [uncultured Aquitalea sp.]
MNKACAALIAALTPLAALAQPNLIGTEWQLSQTPGHEGRAPTLTFRDKGITGFAGCNRFVANSDEQGKLAVATTRMMCAPAVMKQEQALVAFLSAPFRIQVDDMAQKLTLSSDKGKYHFDRLPPPVPARRAAPALSLAQQPQYLFVGAERKPCSAGAGQMSCLQVRGDDKAPWQNFYGEIEGFDPKPGTSYYVKVRYQAVANPPADGSSMRTILDRVVFSETVGG